MVGFAGWSMPLQYKEQSILDSHRHTRNAASLFDVSHMMQTRISGANRVAFMESLTVADLQALNIRQSLYTLFTNTAGGIMDDAICTVMDDHIYLVNNAGSAAKIRAHLSEQLGGFKQGNVVLEELSDRSLLALQGPSSVGIIEELSQVSLSNLHFMTSTEIAIGGLRCLVSRTGYTGEDGVEISVLSKDAVKLALLLLSHPSARLAGLAARDSLRLEAGLCLYGHDLNDSTTPIEAGLSWTLSERRKKNGGFLGEDVVLNQLAVGPQKRRVGMFVNGAPARENATIHNEQGELIGSVTSGGPAPSLDNQPIAMGYVKSGFHKKGTQLQVKVRGRMQPANVVRMPFVKTRYAV